MTSLISIIVPVYNTEEYISECLDSILSQTYPHFEVICVDDGSSDNSRIILEKYQEKDKRIKIIKQKNQGVSVARNSGMEAARSEYLAFLDSDDLWNETFLEKMLFVMESEKVDFVCCGNRRNKKKEYQEDFSKILLKECVFSRFGLLVGNLLVRRTVLKEKEIVFFPGCRFNEDFEFIYKILSVVDDRVAIIMESLYFHREREGAATSEKWLYAHEDKISSFERGKIFILNHYNGNDKGEILLEIKRNQSTQMARLLWGSIIKGDFNFSKYLVEEYPNVITGKTRKIGHSLVLWLGRKPYLWKIIHQMSNLNKSKR